MRIMALFSAKPLTPCKIKLALTKPTVKKWAQIDIRICVLNVSEKLFHIYTL